MAATPAAAAPADVGVAGWVVGAALPASVSLTR
jgi:hypothetical protein